VSIPAFFPSDPFSDKPFLAKATTDGFRIWSVGLNGIDDGGTVKGNNDLDRVTVVGYPYVEKARRRLPVGAAAAALPAR
jgi:hypothetical protein